MAVRLLCILCALAICCDAQTAGAAAAGPKQFFTWGAQLRIWQIASPLTSRVLAEGPFGEGGCTSDLDNDGQPELATVRGKGLGDLTWFRLDGTSERIDTEMEMHDCLEATLFGRRGLLVIQRGIQVRFYQRNEPNSWTSRDIYSIYTPSYQTGLALADVDRDGRTDILCGNYWIQSPPKWEQPWHVFAINTWFEGPEMASFRILPMPGGRGEYAAQAHADPARFGAFTPPADPKQQWTLRLIAPELKWRNVHGLAMVGRYLVAGERAGATSRVVAVDPATNDSIVLGVGAEVVTILPLDSSSFLSVEAAGRVTEWRIPEGTRRRP